MARKKREKEKITDPFERARLKKLRSAQRREERKRRRAEGGSSDEPKRRKSEESDYSTPLIKDDWLWIRAELARSYALRIINNHRERPFWLSVPHAQGDGVPPVSHLFPCTTFRTPKRTYYGFLFREHRDMFFAGLDDARKETTDRVATLNPQLF